jgi:anti-sigma factor ChrR (cupin superfamily)
MYSCRDIHDQASALVDRELSTREAVAVTLHLLMCGACRRFIRQFRLLTRVLRREAQAAEVPAATIDRIVARIPLDDPQAVRGPGHDPT